MIYSDEEKEIKDKLNKIFKEHWNKKDIHCKSAKCVWIDSEKVKEKLFELIEEFEATH